MIYFIQAGEDGPIKIGRSSNEVGRFGGLQTATYERLHLRATLDVPDEIEGYFHTILSGARIRGEWFDSKETIVNIALACALAGHVWEPVARVKEDIEAHKAKERELIKQRQITGEPGLISASDAVLERSFKPNLYAEAQTKKKILLESAKATLGEWNATLQCGLLGIYSYGEENLVLCFPEHHCCDMDGAIKLSQNMMPKVKLIQTVSGEFFDTRYKYENSQWVAQDCRPLNVKVNKTSLAL